MAAEINSDPKRFSASFDNGDLAFSVSFINCGSVKRLFIVRNLKIKTEKQRLNTEQHTLVNNVADFEEWASGDEYRARLPELFENLTDYCRQELA